MDKGRVNDMLIMKMVAIVKTFRYVLSTEIANV